MKSAIKIVRRFFLAILIILMIVTGSLFIIGYFYSDKVEQSVVSELNKHLNMEISISDVDLSLFKNFPNASLKFTNLQTKEKIMNGSNPLLKAGSLYLLFNIYDIFNGEYRIEKIILKDALFNIVIHEDGSNNFTILKKTGQSTSSKIDIDLQEVILQNVEVLYINYPADQEYFFRTENGNVSGQFLSSNYSLSVQGNFYTNYIRSGKTILLKDKQVDMSLKMLVDKDSGIYTIKDSKLALSGLSFDVTGTIKSELANRYLDLSITGAEADLGSFMNEIPDEYRIPVSEAELKGRFSFKAKITGDFSGNNLPLITFDYNVKQGKFSQPKSGVVLNKVSFDGTFSNGKSKSPRSFVIKLNNFKATLKSGFITGRLSVSNFERPEIDVLINSSIEAREVKDLFNIERIESATGSLNINLEFKNRLKSFRTFTLKDFSSSRTTGTLQIKNIGLNLKDDHVVYKNLNGTFNFNNHDLVVKNFSGNVAGSDFQMTGTFDNILAYAFLPHEKITIRANLSSNYLNLDDFIQYKTNKEDTVYNLNFSNNEDFDLDVNIGQLKFRKFTAENLSGQVKMKDKKLFVTNSSFHSMDGKTNLSGIIDGTESGKFLLKCDADVSDVDIRKMFYEFGNFGQDNITDENLSGIVNAHIFFQFLFNPDLSVKTNSVNSYGDLVVSNGELIHYTPLYRLSKFIKKKELEHIYFSTLKNQIQIKNSTVYIPDMNIESSTLNLQLSGKHTFDNDIDYHVRILLADLLSKKKKNEEPIEGTFTQDDGLGRTTVFLKMTGNVDDPEISYDTKAVQDKIASDFKTEKQNLKSVFQKEFKGSANNNEVESASSRLPDSKTESKKGFVITWDEDKSDTTVNTVQKADQIKSTSPKKARTKDFIIKWDEENDTVK